MSLVPQRIAADLPTVKASRPVSHREKCLRGNPTAVAASPAASAARQGLKQLLSSYHDPPSDHGWHHKQASCASVMQLTSVQNVVLHVVLMVPCTCSLSCSWAQPPACAGTDGSFTLRN